jgi:hypothetical protein
VSQDTFSTLPQSLTTNIKLSNIAQVGKNPEANPSSYFGSEPAHTWCYYFEKADLARQFDDWDQVVKLYQAATSAGYTALAPSENLVFIEAFARLGDGQKAGKLSDSTLAQDHKLCKALVAVWERASRASPEISLDAQKKTEFLNDLPECK